MTPEQALDARCKLYAGQRNAMCFHINVGKVKMNDGRFFDTGAPVGFSDLLTILPNGLTMYCETKIHPRKPTEKQIDFINLLRKRKVIAGVAYTVEEYIELFDLAMLGAQELPPLPYPYVKNKK